MVPYTQSQFEESALILIIAAYSDEFPGVIDP
jgi:hypothetical protein